ncbi:PIG-L family deacetylase [Herbiconiux sp. CPCC 203407]|uniref:PIG-L family deacetylase n=1 Tax=Herbiconiux oxytropis TaxID=2970915 RepID=A0AA42BSU8_9MICO|nr:PIG-L family deacetylase [Herbiconiux oxytropis]MCS5723173.1 PIG-L family deacetylase [Herbiconiux oxytropis]MCS5725152.1 PIG-L family deacetylase [Herbiconiux oxytropis]
MTDLAAFGDAPFFLHAHPDDESISTGGTIAALIEAGAEVTVITGTRGERGEVVAGELEHLEGTDELAPHRMGELAAALDALGGPTHAFLGSAPARIPQAARRLYADSGMRWGADGFAEPATDAPVTALSLAPLADVVGDLLAAMLDDARRPAFSSIVSYDARGGYGHPDHVRMHDAGLEIARLTGRPFLAIVEPRIHDAPLPAGEELSVDLPPAALAAKTAAMAAHRSQLTVDPDAGTFTLSGGQTHPVAEVEHFRRVHPDRIVQFCIQEGSCTE